MVRDLPFSGICLLKGEFFVGLPPYGKTDIADGKTYCVSATSNLKCKLNQRVEVDQATFGFNRESSMKQR